MASVVVRSVRPLLRVIGSAFTLAALVLVGCGQRGPLVLPTGTPAGPPKATAQAASAAATLPGPR